VVKNDYISLFLIFFSNLLVSLVFSPIDTITGGVYNCCFLGKNGKKMFYKNVLLTDKEIKILETIISQNMGKYSSEEQVNLTVLLSQLRRNRLNQEQMKNLIN
jgi:CRISPR/Cas system-associated protein Cas5 (RAMP superfamily)